MLVMNDIDGRSLVLMGNSMYNWFLIVIVGY